MSPHFLSYGPPVTLQHSVDGAGDGDKTPHKQELILYLNEALTLPHSVTTYYYLQQNN